MVCSKAHIELLKTAGATRNISGCSYYFLMGLAVHSLCQSALPILNIFWVLALGGFCTTCTWITDKLGKEDNMGLLQLLNVLFLERISEV